MDFKEMLAKDLDVFINPNEFGEEHTLDGETLLMIVSENTSEETKMTPKYQLAMENVFTKSYQLHFFDSIIPMPLEGDQVEFDGEKYFVLDSSVTEGIVSIEIFAHRS